MFLVFQEIEPMVLINVFFYKKRSCSRNCRTTVHISNFYINTRTPQPLSLPYVVIIHIPRNWGQWFAYCVGVFVTEMSKSIVKGIGIGFLSCIGIAKTIYQVIGIGTMVHIGIVKTTAQVLVLLRRLPKYW